MDEQPAYSTQPATSDEAMVVVIKGKARNGDWWLNRYIDAFPRAEIWTLNDDRHPLAARHFELHRPRHHCTLDLSIPVVIHWDEAATAPNEQNFPMVAVRKRYPWIYDFSATPAYMLAYAGLIGASHICLPGCNFTGNEREFTIERHSCEKWICALIGQGITFDIPDDSALMKRNTFYR